MKKFYMIFVLVLCVCIMIPSQSNAKTKKVCLNRSTAKVEVGKKIQVRLKSVALNKQKFQSSNMKIATVSNDGKVQACSSGTCKIIVTNTLTKKKYRCTITVMPLEKLPVQTYKYYCDLQKISSSAIMFSPKSFEKQSIILRTKKEINIEKLYVDDKEVQYTLKVYPDNEYHLIMKSMVDAGEHKVDILATGYEKFETTLLAHTREVTEFPIRKIEISSLNNSSILLCMNIGSPINEVNSIFVDGVFNKADYRIKKYRDELSFLTIIFEKPLSEGEHTITISLKDYCDISQTAYFQDEKMSPLLTEDIWMQYDKSRICVCLKEECLNTKIKFYIDGEEYVPTESGWRAVYAQFENYFDISSLPSGTHTIVIEAENFDKCSTTFTN